MTFSCSRETIIIILLLLLSSTEYNYHPSLFARVGTSTTPPSFAELLLSATAAATSNILVADSNLFIDRPTKYASSAKEDDLPIFLPHFLYTKRPSFTHSFPTRVLHVIYDDSVPIRGLPRPICISCSIPLGLSRSSHKNPHEVHHVTFCGPSPSPSGEALSKRTCLDKNHMLSKGNS